MLKFAGLCSIKQLEKRFLNHWPVYLKRDWGSWGVPLTQSDYLAVCSVLKAWNSILIMNLAILTVETSTPEEKLRVCSAVDEKLRHAPASTHEHGGTLVQGIKLFDRYARYIWLLSMVADFHDYYPNSSIDNFKSHNWQILSNRWVCRGNWPCWVQNLARIWPNIFLSKVCSSTVILALYVNHLSIQNQN